MIRRRRDVAFWSGFPALQLRLHGWRSARAVAAIAGLAWLVHDGARATGYAWQWYRVPAFVYRVVDGTLIWGPLVRGLGMTLAITSAAWPAAAVIGVGVALLRLLGTRVGRAVAAAHVELIRNTPVIIQVYLLYFVAAPVVGMGPFWTGVAALALFEGAAVAEIVRAGLLAVPRGQWEAGSALGLPVPGLYLTVVLPQALRLVLPALVSQTISLVKASSILSVISIFELTTEGRNLIADTFMTFEIWLTVAAIYLVVNSMLSLIADRLDRRLNRPSR